MPDNVVLVVPARRAEHTARTWSIYCCQNHRSFRDADWIAFYTGNAIRLYAKIESVEDDVAVGELPELREYQALLVARGIKAPPRNKLFRLRDVKDIGPIVNDAVDRNGERTAWCQSQRYTTLRQLLSARKTSDLE